jgi:tetratricopeptide (TPR) repeat protein
MASARMSRTQFLIDKTLGRVAESQPVAVPSAYDIPNYLQRVATSYRSGDLLGAKMTLHAVRKAVALIELNPPLAVRAVAGASDIANLGSNPATLNHAARVAYRAGQFEMAASYATKAIMANRALSHADDSLLMESYNLRGASRLAQGDLGGATDDLNGSIANAKSFGVGGPSMLLAKKLMERGNATPVLQYLSFALSIATPDEQSVLNGWKTQITQNKVPNFGANGLR